MFMNRRSIRILLPFLVLLFISIALLPLFVHQGPNTHDGINQVIRFAAYEKAFQDMHIPPRWAADLNYGYGIPVMNFFYPLSGYLASLLGVFSFSYEQRIVLLSAFSIAFGGLFWYLWARRYQGRANAFFVSILFALAPYQLLNIYVRGDIGELLALNCIPFILWVTDTYIQKKNILWFVLLSFALGLLILAHQGVALFSLPFLALYMIVQLRKERLWFFQFLLLLIVAFGMSAYFWVPVLYEQRYVLGSVAIGQDVTQHFLDLQRIIMHVWNYGAHVNESGGQSPQIGLVAFFAFVLSCLFLFRKKQRNKAVLLVFFVGMIVSVFFMLPVSTWVWDTVTIIQKLQFPWRFMGLLTVCVIGCITIALPKLPRWLLLLFFLGIVMQAYGQMKPNEYVHYEDTFYRNNPGTTYFHEEATPVWTSGSASSYPKENIEVIGGEGEIHIQSRSSQRIQAELSNVKQGTQLLINTLYYPGWHVFVDGEEVPIEFQNMNHRGLMIVSIPEGSTSLTAEFSETKIRFLSNTISVGVLVMMIVLSGYSVWLRAKQNRRDA
jgi:hypothetical protein